MDMSYLQKKIPFKRLKRVKLMKMPKKSTTIMMMHALCPFIESVCKLEDTNYFKD